MSVLINYSNAYSVGGKAVNDMYIAEENGIIGSNADSMRNLVNGVLVVTTNSNRTRLQICEIIRPASSDEASVWERAGGKNWKYNYTMNVLVSVTKISKLVKIIVKEIACGRDNIFWDSKVHHNYPDNERIVRKLVYELG
jgi:hypothetical protein